ncbi:hypothetical protein V5738_13375 [Salinisphaera sp. SPP-AMP-43]|uniref:hypothetical protein n=1 Tax=Salinisphaera sp. SPP-AMP-43 TaxID=3121288 RepID=UPI003C6DE8DF
MGMTPMFFGPGEALYGSYHAPAPGTPGVETALVVCQSIGHEYMRGYRACWQLAEAAAERNAHVLRFDYPATGDSAGRQVEADWQSWLASVDRAIDWLGEITGLAHIRLIGVRAGSLIAAAAAARRQQSRRVVLIDPVVDGERYMADLSTLHVAQIDGMNRYRPRRHHHATYDTDEWLGFHWPKAVVEPLKAQRLAEIDSERLDDWHLATSQGQAQPELAQSVIARGGQSIELTETWDWDQLEAQYRRITLARSLSSLLDLSLG